MTGGKKIPSSFIWRRLHSLTGIWFSLFLITHLLTNSQAALFIGDDGRNFIKSVNSIYDLPYLRIIEILFLATPIFIHTVWGIKYALTAKYNSFGSWNETEPYLPQYPRNHAYTWQRFCAWFLVIGVMAHVVHMRFIEYPVLTGKGNAHAYLTRVETDAGLYPLAARLGVTLYSSEQIDALERRFQEQGEKELNALQTIAFPQPEEAVRRQTLLLEKERIAALNKKPLAKGQAIAAADNFGTAELLMVRNTFKSPLMIALYSAFVIIACYHAFNGLWTFLIKWGITLSERSQRLFRSFSTGLMLTMMFLGLSAVWMTYWVNLKQ